MPEAPARAAPRIILAFDYGRRRIGVASGDTVSRAASPIAALTPHRGGAPWDAIGRLLADWRPAIAVVGVPYNADGSDSPLAREARAFAAKLAGRFPVRVDLVDERYSSLEAEARLREARAAGLRRRRVAKSDVDAAAACVILERWFDEKGGMDDAKPNG